MYAIFNGYDLNQANTYQVISINAKDIPSINLNKHKLVRADGEKITGMTYGSRKVIIQGRILASNEKDMETKRDNLYLYLRGIDKNLDIYVADVTRRFVATLESLKISESGYHTTWEAVFICDPYGEDISTTSLSIDTPKTTSSDTDNQTILGTGNAKPVIDFTINGVDPNFESKYIDLSNTALSKKIRLTREWNWFDRVIIDCNDKTVNAYLTTKTVIDDCESNTPWSSTNGTKQGSTGHQGDYAIYSVMASAFATLDISKLNFSPTLDLSSDKGVIIMPVKLPTPVSGTLASIDFKIGSDTTLGTNSCYWRITTQWDGSPLAVDGSWNWIKIDLSVTPDGTTGTPNRALIKSLGIIFNATTTIRFSPAIDYITLNKASATAEEIDYEGIFPEFEPGSAVLTYGDELTMRSIAITGTYTKRYL